MTNFGIFSLFIRSGPSKIKGICWSHTIRTWQPEFQFGGSVQGQCYRSSILHHSAVTVTLFCHVRYYFHLKITCWKQECLWNILSWIRSFLFLLKLNVYRKSSQGILSHALLPLVKLDGQHEAGGSSRKSCSCCLCREKSNCYEQAAPSSWPKATIQQN